MKNGVNLLITTATVVGLVTSGILAEPSKNFKVFLCFGQSNMSGGNGVQPGPDEKKTNPRIKVLAFANCGNPPRTKNQWADACEPMHCGDNMNTMGPSYVFGIKMAEALPDDTIGLIPCGQWGVGIEMFTKGGNYTGANKPNEPGGNNVYPWMLEKCKISMQRGIFSGIVLHQGESNSGDAKWPQQVKSIVDDLKKDLGITENIPLVVGELLYSGQCAGHNKVIANIPSTIPNSYIASAQGLSGVDQYHFNADGYRKMGDRMATEMLKGLEELAKTAVSNPRSQPGRVISPASVNSIRENVNIYTLNGKLVSNGMTFSKVGSSVIPGNIYIVSNKINGATTKLMIAPTAR